MQEEQWGQEGEVAGRGVGTEGRDDGQSHGQLQQIHSMRGAVSRAASWWVWRQLLCSMRLSVHK